MRHIALIAAGSLLAIAASIGPAVADGCTGHDHDTGTVVGGVGGAAIGGLASHSVVGAVAGGVVGALAGNAIARSEDCDHQARVESRDDRRAAYEAGRDDQAHEDANVNGADRQQAYVAGRDDQAASEAERQARMDENGHAPDSDQYPR